MPLDILLTIFRNVHSTMQFPTSALTSLVVGLLLSTVAPVNAATSCETVTSWNNFVNRVNAAMRENRFDVCFHPFRILKKASDTRLLLYRPISLRCEKDKTSDQCTIDGAGHHIRIAGSNAEAVIEGFTFIGATQCAVRILSTAVKMQNIVDCNYIDNEGSFNGWRGGAIKTELGTSLTISSSYFDGNAAAGGGGIFHAGDQLVVVDSAFANNRAKEGGAIFSLDGAASSIYDTVFNDNSATISKGGAIEATSSSTIVFDVLTGSGNSPCNGIYDRSVQRCETMFTVPSFVLGELSFNAMGFRMSTGLNIKRIGTAGQRLVFTSPERDADKSARTFHTNPDGAAVFELPDGGWIYLSNAENLNGNGGVYGVVFDAQGRIKDYVQRLTGTTRNCSGGPTPWNSFISCEEYGRGQCWQVDPAGKRPSVKTKLVEPAGGNFESFAYDITDPKNPYYFVTEDHKRGALRRFRPSDNNNALNWNSIQGNGKIDYLQFNNDFTFQWTSSLEAGRASAEKYFQFVEGISFDDGILSFVSKNQKEIFRLNLARGKYTVESTDRGTLPGGGTFGAGPDQILQNGDMLYITEDGGGNPGVYVTDGVDYYALLEGPAKVFRGDETTGMAFSPDGTKLYVCIQEIGFLFEVSRDDGLPFPGNYKKISHLRWHEQEPE